MLKKNKNNIRRNSKYIEKKEKREDIDLGSRIFSNRFELFLRICA